MCILVSREREDAYKELKNGFQTCPLFLDVANDLELQSEKNHSVAGKESISFSNPGSRIASAPHSFIATQSFALS
jgi:hypothetical protein